MDIAIYKSDERQAFGLVESSTEGISSDEAEQRLERYGANVIEEKRATPLWRKILSNFTHFFAILLWIAGILAFVGGTPELGYACFAVVFINAAFTFWQEYKAEKAIENLKKILPRKARVIRDGRETEIEAEHLVPGDLISLEAGNHISADARLVQVSEMQVDNSALTGESEPQRRRSGALSVENAALADIPNLVFAGTNVTAGGGKAVVYATGMDTEIGKIAGMTQAVKEEPSPLQKEMGRVTKIIAVIATSLGVIFFALGAFVIDMGQTASFIFAVGIIVANVPEGLLPTVTLSLAMGTQRMAHRHALIKKLSSVETLGSTTVICTDKTGTLTANEMTVREVWAGGLLVHVGGTGYEPVGEFDCKAARSESVKESVLRELFRIASFCNNARLLPPDEDRERWSILGDPTEASLLVAARKSGFDYTRELQSMPRRYELPFDSKRKRMTTIHASGGGVRALVKGAPREVMDLCTRIWEPSGIREITEEDRELIAAKNDDYARRALRVLGFAYRDIGSERRHYDIDEIEKDLVFVGLVGMMDPPRPEVEEAIKKCRTAGIKVIMITGDYGVTAESIARRIGLVKGPEVKVITGLDLDRMSDEELGETLREQQVIFARVSPEHKMRVAQVLKSDGEVVAMTGDGINDAPALKAADIGVAMGVSGTDVAKEAADMILTDDNFASIVSAVEEGRAVFDNIKRFVTYILASNIPEIVPFLLFVIARIPLPLTVMQILAVDLGTDLVPALALGTEKPEKGVMEKPPRSSHERLLNMRLLARAYGFLGPIEALACMAGFYFVYWQSNLRIPTGAAARLVMEVKNPVYVMATTACLATIVTTQIGNGFACRTTRESIFKVGFTSNRFYLLGIASELAFIAIFIYVPPFNNLFGLKPLSAETWLFMFAWTPVIFFASEARKSIIRKYESVKAEKPKGAARTRNKKAA
ncbi:MAG: cation-transporting P-type ATPase [Actinomycetia bacterium]|nr:cation-transporting P-type ATPase [Actinomycetes bacterium]